MICVLGLLNQREYLKVLLPFRNVHFVNLFFLFPPPAYLIRFFPTLHSSFLFRLSPPFPVLSFFPPLSPLTKFFLLVSYPALYPLMQFLASLCTSFFSQRRRHKEGPVSFLATSGSSMLAGQTWYQGPTSPNTI